MNDHYCVLTERVSRLCQRPLFDKMSRDVRQGSGTVRQTPVTPRKRRGLDTLHFGPTGPLSRYPVWVPGYTIGVLTLWSGGSPGMDLLEVGCLGLVGRTKRVLTPQRVLYSRSYDLGLSTSVYPYSTSWMDVSRRDDRKGREVEVRPKVSLSKPRNNRRDSIERSQG